VGGVAEVEWTGPSRSGTRDVNGSTTTKVAGGAGSTAGLEKSSGRSWLHAASRQGTVLSAVAASSCIPHIAPGAIPSQHGIGASWLAQQSAIAAGQPLTSMATSGSHNSRRVERNVSMDQSE